MNDYYRLAPEVYDTTTRGIPGDIAFYRDLAVASGGPTVELGVGTGRIAVPTALAGVEVTGIDLSPEMLAVARRHAQEAGVAARLRLVVGDMRTFTVTAPVPLVTIPFRTFLHNLDEADQLATLRACHRALIPGGRLALNVFNLSPALFQREGWRGPRPYGQGGRVAADHRVTDERVVTTRLSWRTDGGSRRASLTLRYITMPEMRTLLERSGFEVEALHGDCLGGPFEEASTEQVWVARRTS